MLRTTEKENHESEIPSEGGETEKAPHLQSETPSNGDEDRHDHRSPNWMEVAKLILHALEIGLLAAAFFS